MSDPRRVTRDGDWVYELLPEIFRIRDAERGYQLRPLVRAVQVQADQFADDIWQLYANWFIETCADDLVPYFAELVGLSLGPRLKSDRTIDPVLRRQQVANAIRDRRRKGTFAVLEQLAADATGWPARAVEAGMLAMSMPSVALPDVGLRGLVDLHDADALEQLGSPLSTVASLSDVRRVSSHRTPGAGGPGEVAVWVWRLVAERVSRAPAANAGEDAHFTFDQLGRDTELAHGPTPRAAGKPATFDLDVPAAITRVALAHRLEDYYGPGRSICVYRGRDAVPRSEILVADLGGWRARTPAGFVSVDPELGRIAFPARYAPQEGVSVTYSRLGVGAIGGGGYERPFGTADSNAETYRVGAAGSGVHRSVGAALSAWRRARKKGTRGASAIVEILDDGVYEERYELDLEAGERLEIRAASGRRPVLVPVAARGNRADQFRVCGLAAAGGEREGAAYEPEPGPPVLVLNGIWVAGAAVELTGSFGQVGLCHCTLVPTGGVNALAEERDHQAPALIVRAMPCPISISHSVIGRVRVESPEAGFDPLPVSFADSVIDCGTRTGSAVLGADDRRAWVRLSLSRTTVFGALDVEAAERINDSILTAPLRCERRQTGTVTFSYVHPWSETPRRTSCQPDDVIAAVEDGIAAGKIASSERIRLEALEAARVAPRFDAVRFGDSAYARLAPDAAAELTRGAHDEGELGAYHNLWQAQRMADLNTRLQEFAPVGTDIDIRVAT